MELISEDYQKIQSQLHKDRPDYGEASTQLASTVSDLINNNHFTTVLDYGSGKGRLMNHLTVNHDIHLRCYDPAIEQFSRQPEPVEFVCCLDVLEHVEPHCLDAVLDHLKQLTQKLALLTIHTGAARKSLPDGRNAHLIQESTQWWLPKIIQRFELEHLVRSDNGFIILVIPKQTH